MRDEFSGENETLGSASRLWRTNWIIVRPSLVRPRFPIRWCRAARWSRGCHQATSRTDSGGLLLCELGEMDREQSLYFVIVCIPETAVRPCHAVSTKPRGPVVQGSLFPGRRGPVMTQTSSRIAITEMAIGQCQSLFRTWPRIVAPSTITSSYMGVGGSQQETRTRCLATG